MSTLKNAAPSAITTETAAAVSVRDFDTVYGKLYKNFSRVLRDRNGSFEQQLIPELISELIPDYVRRTDDLETTIITLYRKGITTREITDLIEKIYGQHYSPATMSSISKAVAEQVETFHKRPLSERYVIIFMDATYLNVRRDSAAEEPLLVLAGIAPDGTREVPRLCPVSRPRYLTGISFAVIKFAPETL